MQHMSSSIGVCEVRYTWFQVRNVWYQVSESHGISVVSGGLLPH